MDKPVAGRKVRLSALGGWWFGGIWAVVIAGAIAGFFNDATELTPDHRHFYTVFASVAAAFVSVLAGLTQSKGPWFRRAVMVVLFGLLGGGATFYLACSLAAIADMQADFPAGKTQTYPAYVMIGRAYRTRARALNWHIQTTPLWSDLRIGQRDYDFMASHRSPRDRVRNPDEISSRGWFCAHVTMQRSGSAQRILHTRSALPDGTVGLCTDALPKAPVAPPGGYSVRDLDRRPAPVPDGAVIRLHAEVYQGEHGLIMRDERCRTLCDDVHGLTVPDGEVAAQFLAAGRAAQGSCYCDGRKTYFDMVVKVRVADYPSPPGSTGMSPNLRVSDVTLVKVLSASVDTPEHWLAAHKAG